MLVDKPRLIAIIGCGAIVESATLPALRRIGWLPGVLVDTSPRRLEVIASRMDRQGKRVIFGLPAWESVLGEFDAAIVALPHALHGAIGAALLKRRKTCVHGEKPLATTADQCRAMTTAAELGGSALSVGLLRRYLRIARWTKALLESGVLGEVKYFDAREGFVFDSDPSSDALLRSGYGRGRRPHRFWGPYPRPDRSGGSVMLSHLQYRDDSAGGVEADCPSNVDLHRGLVAAS